MQRGDIRPPSSQHQQPRAVDLTRQQHMQGDHTPAPVTQTEASTSTSRARISDHVTITNVQQPDQGPPLTTISPGDATSPRIDVYTEPRARDATQRARRPLPPTPNDLRARASTPASTGERLTRSMVDALRLGQHGRQAENRQSDAAPQPLQRDGARDTTRATDDPSRRTSDRYMAFIPRRLQNYIARRAADAFVRRGERIENFNRALRTVHDISQEYTRQLPHGLHPAHLHRWEQKLNQAQTTLQHMQQKGLTNTARFIAYNTTRINRSLSLVNSYGQTTPAEQQRLTTHKDALLATTRNHPATEVAGALQAIETTRRGLTMARRDLSQNAIYNAISEDKVQLAQQNLGLTAMQYRDIVTSGQYLPLDNITSSSYNLAWENPDGNITVRQFQPNRRTNKADTYAKGQARDKEILRYCDAENRVVQLLPPDKRFQCHGLTFAAGDASISHREVGDILNTRFYPVQNMREARPGDIVVYRDEYEGVSNRIMHSGVVVANNNGDVICVSKLDAEGGTYMHHPQDFQAVSGTPTLYRSNHPAGRFLMPDNTIDLERLTREGYV